MTTIVVLLFVVVLGLLGVWFSPAGKNLQAKTDAQLYVRYERWRTHRMKFDLASNGHTEATNEIVRMEEEIKRRGYDLNKLAEENIMAQLENRVIDFSRCRSPSI